MADPRDRRFMKMALRLARRGVGLASPNPTVGCVIVAEGEVVGRGWHDYGRVDHAEVAAVREAGARARGAEAYITLEPCSHQGRTAPCAGLLVNAGIRRAVISIVDPNPLVSGRGIDFLRVHGIETEVGLLSEEASELIEPFACRIVEGRPLVVAKVGMSLDGRIAAPRGDERRLTSPESGEFAQDLRLRSDALLIGVGTVLKDDPVLTYRGRTRRRRPLLRVILDSELRTPPEARVFESPSVLLFCAPRYSSDRRLALESRGAEVVPAPGLPRNPDIGFVLEELARREVTGVLVEGGSRIHWTFLSRRFVDKFYFIVAPLVLGGAAVPAVAGEGYCSLPDAPRFMIRRSFSAGPDVVLEAFPSYSKSILSPWRG